MTCGKCKLEMPDVKEDICVKHKVKTSCCHQCYKLSYHASEQELLPFAQNPALSLCIGFPGSGRRKDAQKCNPKQT